MVTTNDGFTVGDRVVVTGGDFTACSGVIKSATAGTDYPYRVVLKGLAPPVRCFNADELRRVHIGPTEHPHDLTEAYATQHSELVAACHEITAQEARAEAAEATIANVRAHAETLQSWAAHYVPNGLYNAGRRDGRCLAAARLLEILNDTPGEEVTR